jgi:hypothetical protein
VNVVDEMLIYIEAAFIENRPALPSALLFVNVEPVTVI